MVAEKKKAENSHIIALLRLRISFARIRSSLVCLRSSRRLKATPVTDPEAPPIFILTEAKLTA